MEVICFDSSMSACMYVVVQSCMCKHSQGQILQILHLCWNGCNVNRDVSNSTSCVFSSCCASLHTYTYLYTHTNACVHIFLKTKKQREREKKTERKREEADKDDRKKEWKEQLLILSLIDSYECPHTQGHTQHQYA